MNQDIKTALTYDDILLVPQYSDAVPTEISTKAEFARDVILNTPIISAAMDTVTENKMARILAQQGGLGVIHKNMTIESQAFEVGTFSGWRSLGLYQCEPQLFSKLCRYTEINYERIFKKILSLINVLF